MALKFIGYKRNTFFSINSWMCVKFGAGADLWGLVSVTVRLIIRGSHTPKIGSHKMYPVRDALRRAFSHTHVPMLGRAHTNVFILGLEVV